MDDVRALKELQLDALREVANIGAGHAATALSQLTGRTVMIGVPEVNVRPTGDGMIERAPVSAPAISGSSAMPQIGQEPGPTWRISGCIGQV